MKDRLDRRTFLKTAAALGAAVSASARAGENNIDSSRTVRVGVVGTGARGTGLLGILLSLEGVSIPALCDVDPEPLANAQRLVVDSGRPKPEGYTKNEYAFQDLMARDDLDAVIIATPWNWHTPMAVYAMEHGKYVGVEVPCSTTLEECWALVHTSEKTNVPCMMLENWSFREDNLAVLQLIRAGLLGEMIHCHCAHSHDCIDHWFFDKQGNMRWGADFLLHHNRDQYPTHSLGPVMSWMDINCGDRFKTVTSTATRSCGINAYFARTFGADHPNARREYKQGDIVTSVIQTERGNSIVVNYDMQLPRPYDNRWMIQGTLGLYDEDKAAVYLTGKSPHYHEWEPFAPYLEQYRHPWWKNMRDRARTSHGGTDHLQLIKFIEAVRTKSMPPIDVYDSVTMSSLVALSEKSIARGSAPVKCPDFTRGKWKDRKPSFAVVS